MSTILSDTLVSHSRTVARYTARLDACWPQVRVESAQLSRGPSGARACAVVQLGGLAPADVRVELVPASRAQAVLPPGHGEYRMFSRQSYHNGSFVFETTLPRQEAERNREWLIHVHPSEALEEPRVEYRFRSMPRRAP